MMDSDDKTLWDDMHEILTELQDRMESKDAEIERLVGDLNDARRSLKWTSERAEELGNERDEARSELSLVKCKLTEYVQRCGHMEEIIFDAEGLLEEQGRPEGERIDKGIEALISERDEREKAARHFWLHGQKRELWMLTGRPGWRRSDDYG